MNYKVYAPGQISNWWRDTPIAGILPTDRREYQCSKQFFEDKEIYLYGTQIQKNLLEWELSLRAG